MLCIRIKASSLPRKSPYTSALDCCFSARLDPDNCSIRNSVRALSLNPPLLLTRSFQGSQQYHWNRLVLPSSSTGKLIGPTKITVPLVLLTVCILSSRMSIICSAIICVSPSVVCSSLRRQSFILLWIPLILLCRFTHISYITLNSSYIKALNHLSLGKGTSIVHHIAFTITLLYAGGYIVTMMIDCANVCTRM
jgi:hypothetical protein